MHLVLPNLNLIFCAELGGSLSTFPHSWSELTLRSTLTSPLPARLVVVSLEESRERTRRRLLVEAVMVMRMKSDHVMIAPGFVLRT